MPKMKIYPAIDLMGGKAVRLSQGRRETAKIYSESPWELVTQFAGAGAVRVHVVDLDAAFSGGEVHNRTVIGKIAQAAAHASHKVDIEVGGGVRSAADCEALFALGVRYAVLGTVAIKDPGLVTSLCQRYPGHIVVAVDALDGKVAVEGWQEATAVSAIDIGRRVASAGAAAVLYTDISRDGMRTGPNIEATQALAQAIAPCEVIASGGVAQLSDLDALTVTGATAVIIGKAIYEKVFTVAEAVARAGVVGAQTVA